MFVTAVAHAQVAWAPCVLDEVAAECATVTLPLYRQPDLGSIEVAVARLPALQPPRGELWFVDGGPGDAALASLPRLEFLREAVPDLDIVTFDHRGVGGSRRLTCPDQEDPDSAEGREIVGDEWVGCIDHLWDEETTVLGALTTTAAAQDLGDLVALSDAPQAYVWGISYGSYLVNRYLQLFPDGADGVILDGIAPGDWTFDTFDGGQDDTTRRFLQRCADDPDCRAHLGSDPVARTEALYEALDDGHCARLGLDSDILRILLGVFMVVEDLRTYVPVVVYRLEQCRGRDLRAFVHLFDTLFPEDGGIGEPSSHSQALQMHVALSEMWAPEAPDAATLAALRDTYVATTGVSASFAEVLELGWPTTPRDPRAGGFASTDVPMLMLHGGLDPTIPLSAADVVAEVFDGEAQTFVPFEDGGHVVINEGGCALDLYQRFLEDPRAEVDDACLADRPALSFASDPEHDLEIWGTEDLWGDQRCGCRASGAGPGVWWMLAALTAACRRRRAVGSAMLRTRRGPGHVVPDRCAARRPGDDLRA